MARDEHDDDRTKPGGSGAAEPGADGEPKASEACEHPSHHDHEEPPSWVERTFGGFLAGVAGVVLFFGSFALLYENEGRLDEAGLIRGATPIDAQAPQRDAVGKLVSATGTLTGGAPLGDSFLVAGPYLQLDRHVETFAWVEEQKIHPTKLTTIVAYKRIWTSTPPDSRAFKVQAGHLNPSLGVQAAHWTTAGARVGALSIDPSQLSLGSAAPVPLAAANTKDGVVAGAYLYLNGARPTVPRVGDVRLAYSAVQAGDRVTAIGQLAAGNALKPFESDTMTVYKLYQGTRADNLNALSRTSSLVTWCLRLLGFAMMWAGMRLVMEPFNTLFNRVPYLNMIGRDMTGAVTFPAALTLSAVTIGVAWLTHSALAMGVVGALTLVGCVAVFGRKRVPEAG